MSRSVELLMIEDNDHFARIVDFMLSESKDADYKITRVIHFSGACEVIAKKKFDAITLDLTLPNGAGVKLVSELKKIVPDTPVVVMTGLSGSEIVLESLRASCEEVVLKEDIRTAKDILFPLQKAIARCEGRVAFSGVRRAIDNAQKTLDAVSNIQDTQRETLEITSLSNRQSDRNDKDDTSLETRDR